jgi:methionyl-tRNA formyltransferase
MRAVFMGSPDFAVPSLLRLAEVARIVGVVTQPDRPAGRGRSLTPPPVKVAAESLGLPIRQPEKMREPAFLEWLTALGPDIVVVTAFGRILKPDILELPSLGCVNVHASLLPRWRGASPVQSAILAGDVTTGVTIMRMDAGMDTGPVYARRAIPIPPDVTGGGLSGALAVLGADLLVETLPAIADGTLIPVPQDNEGATYAPLLKKADGRLDPARPADELARQVRALQPWPGAYLEQDGSRFAVLRGRSAPGEPARPGDLVALDDEPGLVTCRGVLVLEEVQPAGRRPQTGREFLRGSRSYFRPPPPSA